MKIQNLYNLYQTTFGNDMPLQEDVFYLYIPQILEEIGLGHLIQPKGKQVLKVEKTDNSYFIKLPEEASKILMVYSPTKDVRLGLTNVMQMLDTTEYLSYHDTTHKVLLVDQDYEELQVTYETLHPHLKDINLIEEPKLQNVLLTGIFYFNLRHLWLVKGKGTAERVAQAKTVYEADYETWTHSNILKDIQMTHAYENF